MYPFKRREIILSKLHHIGEINIAEDMKLLGVSSATLHRDLDALEKEGLVKKIRGGAVPAEGFVSMTHFDIRVKTHSKEKETIAKKAVETISDDSSIFLDHSSSCYYLACELKERSFRNLTVLTNSMVIPFELAGTSGIQVTMTGGAVEIEFKALSGRWVLEHINRLNLHQIFISVGAISLEKGLMTQIQFIQELHPKIINSGQQINILADSSKFFKIATFQISPLKDSFQIFSNDNLPKELIEKIERKGPRIIC